MMKKTLSILFCSIALVACIEDSKVTEKHEQQLSAKKSHTLLVNAAEMVCKDKLFPATKPFNKDNSEQNALSAHVEKCASVKQLVNIHIPTISTILLCDRQWKRTEPPLAESYKGANILSAHYMMGYSFSTLMLFDSKQALAKEIILQDELSALPVTLASANAALAWGYLNGALGRTFDASALCGGSVTENDSGWLITNANVFAKNCAPREKRDISISRAGEVKLLKSTIDPNEPALCID